MNAPAGGVTCPESSSPQQATEWSVRSAQLWKYPAVTSATVPGVSRTHAGGPILLAGAVRSDSQAMVNTNPKTVSMRIERVFGVTILSFRFRTRVALLLL